VKRVAAPLVTAALGAALIALLAYGLAARGADRSLDDAVAHGQRPAAPDRRLPVLGSGDQRRLADYRGQVVLVNFWASWCVPCASEAPLLQKGQATLERHRATVLGVAFRDTTPDALAFVRAHHLTYPSLRDVDGALAQAFATVALPESFLLDREGRIVALSRGEIGPRFLDRAITLAERS